MPRVTRGAGADGAVGVRLANVMAHRATLGDGRRAFHGDQRIGAALDRAGMELLGEGDLLGGEIGGAAHGRPGGSGMAAAQVLAVLRGVALAAIRRGQRLGDREPAMLQRLLAIDGLMAIQAGHAHLHMAAAFELMHDGRGLAAMAFRALAGGADEGGRRLLQLDLGAKAIDDERGDDQRAADHYGNEDGAEGHGVWFLVRLPENDPSRHDTPLYLAVYSAAKRPSNRNFVS